MRRRRRARLPSTFCVPGRGQLITPDVAARFSEANPAGGSGVIVPLRARGADIGVLAVFDRLDPEHPFGPDDVVALESFASSAATRIVAARALEDERLSLSISSSERERQRWARELHDETLQELGALNVMQESALQVDDDEAAKTRPGAGRMSRSARSSPAFRA